MESVEERLKELTAVLTELKSKMDEQQDRLLQMEREMNNAEEAEKENEQEGKKEECGKVIGEGEEERLHICVQVTISFFNNLIIIYNLILVFNLV